MYSEPVKYPNIRVKLTGKDGNAFAILGAVCASMRQAGLPKSEISKFTREASSGDYDHLLCTVQDWVVVT